MVPFLQEKARFHLLSRSREHLETCKGEMQNPAAYAKIIHQRCRNSSKELRSARAYGAKMGRVIQRSRRQLKSGRAGSRRVRGPRVRKILLA